MQFCFGYCWSSLVELFTPPTISSLSLWCADVYTLCGLPISHWIISLHSQVSTDRNVFARFKCLLHRLWHQYTEPYCHPWPASNARCYYTLLTSTLTWLSVMGNSDLSVVFQPSVHGVVTVTWGVHWLKCSFLGNHGKVPIFSSPANAGLEIFVFLGLFWPQNPAVTVTYTKSVQFTTLHHSSEHLVEIVQLLVVQGNAHLHACYRLHGNHLNVHSRKRKAGQGEYNQIATDNADFEIKLSGAIHLPGIYSQCT
jgi:hypothetical protein